MAGNKTVRINNRLYDAVTGLPIEQTPQKRATAPAKAPAVTPAKKTTHPSAAAVHSAPQRSQTLYRRATKKPGFPKRPQPGVHMDIARSNDVTRFAKHPVTKPTVRPVTKDVAPVTHPVAKRAATKAAKPTTRPAATAKQVKDTAIAKALAPKAPAEKKTPKAKKARFSWSRRMTIITAILVVLIGAAAVTYMNLPSITVAFARSQANVNASYPKYIPDGYGLSQPVTYKDGEVGLTFRSKANEAVYTITQTRSSWDSSAVLDNIVRKTAGDNYTINQEQGLTIYFYDDNAAWVNGGILYTIESDAPLSGDQMRRIATSL